MDKEHHTPPGARPLVIFDGDCGFCRRWIDRWREETGEAVDYAPYQEVAARFPEVPVDAFRHAVHYVDREGQIHRGADAVFSALAVSPLKKLPLLAYRHLPGARAISEAGYRWVAAHRPLTDRLTLLLWGRDVRIPAYRIASDIFLRGLGLVYLIAFLSLAVQVKGLIGASGILPAARFLDAVSRAYGAAAPFRLPTLAWLNASDPFLVFLCVAGAVCGALAFLRVATFPALLLAWVFYLSLVSAGQIFLGFQWDNLLLETGLLALFITPLRFRARFGAGPSPPRFGLFLLFWLLFRLIFSSGVVKLTSGDPSWSHLTALQFHYETQCLPTWVAWYAHQLPGWFQKMSALVMFGIELVLPVLIFLPRRLRLTACAGFVGLQVITMLTGNYGFFNLLTIVLCVLLIDDLAWPEWVQRRAGRREEFKRGEAPPRDAPRSTHRITRVILAAFFLMSLIPFGALFCDRRPAPVQRFFEMVYPFRILNFYGAWFVNMQRPEFSIEGSLDGQEWREYPFRWKPGDPARKPPFVAPHTPRLDSVMWFAAISEVETQPYNLALIRTDHSDWMFALLRRLHEGAPSVEALFESNPFSGGPPPHIRAVFREYRFSTPLERRATGAWWVPGEPESYFPPGSQP